MASQLKTPKGTQDWIGTDVALRERIFQAATEVFKRHGGTPLDTPVFELKEILSNKYGEEGRLVYDLEDQGGELLSLRYDLTIPFARYLAMHNIKQIKRYQIAKVYRRDQPALARGRYREFYQCDFDFAGAYDDMIPDAELMYIIVEVFEALGLDVVIKINHRKILDGLFAVVGVQQDKIRTISSAVDKLDKLPWAEVKKEMEEKGLQSSVADDIGSYLNHSSKIEELRSDARLSANQDVQKGLADMDLFFRYLDVFNITDKVSFDLTLARGLDYYTGLIFEVIQDSSSQVGSIAGGGRYDNLVGMFGKTQIPCIGVSFGVERIFTILNSRREKVKDREIDVFVMAFGGKAFDGLLVQRMAIARELWKANIRTEFTAKVKPKLPQQFKAAESGNVPLAVILGEEELAAGSVRLKVLGAVDEPDKAGRLVSRQDLVQEVKKLL